MTFSELADEVLYLDFNATTPMDTRVLDAMDPYLRSAYGNAASTHAAGARALQAVELARSDIADLIRARAQDVVFTSGATESNNLALAGAIVSRSGHVVSVRTEHKSVLDPLQHLARSGGVDVTLLEPNEYGVVRPDDVRDALRPNTILVSVMAANNEVGSLSDIDAIGRLCSEHGAIFHCDAAQLVGKLPIDVGRARIDLLSISAHKMYGPKGVGALYVRRGTSIEPIIRGGGHERGLRSGTLNVPAIVGFGAAGSIARSEMGRDAEHCERLRAILLARLTDLFPGVEVNGHPTERLPGTLNVRLPGINADSLQLAAPRVAVSSGSACTSATPEPSHVLLAMGRSWEAAHESIRFGVGRQTTEAEVLAAVEGLHEAAMRLDATDYPVMKR